MDELTRTLEDDLMAIVKAINDKTMPPFRYRILHPGTSITEDEKTAIIKWVQSARK